MKIEWLNDDCTEAYVTRGVLWWKRQAHVKREENGTYYWNFVTTGRSVPDSLREFLSERRWNAVSDKREWVPVARRPHWGALPPARIVERKTGGAE